jgi:alkylhydroperoxidase/carboxymuconolactone decarboxylase family protein YurZ
MLVSMGAPAELRVHVRAGLRHGLARAEIEEIIHHLALYAGVPRAVEATREARAAFDEAAAAP